MKTYQIHLIRNGRTDDSTSGRYIGHTDAILSPEGVAELHRLKEQADYPYVEAVFTSPLKRCTQTAHAIYPEREAIVMRELIEYDFGEYEGKTPEQLADDEGFASWLAVGRMPPAFRREQRGVFHAGMQLFSQNCRRYDENQCDQCRNRHAWRRYYDDPRRLWDPRIAYA